MIYSLFAVLIAGITMNFIHYMHMFQLNSYKSNLQFKWLGQNIKTVIFTRLIPILSLVVFLIHPEIIGFIIAVVMNSIVMTLVRPKEVKKKLVYTPRVIRMCVTSSLIYLVLTTLFFVLDGNIYVLFILLIITEYIVMIANLVNRPIEKAINQRLINEAKKIITDLPNLIVVGITGSYGKTSTKYYLNTLLSAKYNVLMTPESFNTTLGVVKVIRNSLNPMHEIFICEMGAKNVGEIKEICDIVKPRHSMITSIGPQHLESFKSLENIIKTKFEIADAITQGTVFLNYDNENIKSQKIEKNIIKYGILADNNNTLDYYADEISTSEKGTGFYLTAPDKQRLYFETKLLGHHNVQNIVGAIAAAHFLGVEFEKLQFAVKRLESVPHRLQMIHGNDKIIIDDAFNSNPSGAKAAIDVLGMIEGVKILVTPGMVELGKEEYELNFEFGSYAAPVCDYAVLIGEKRAIPIKEGLLKNNFDNDRIKIFSSLKEGLHFIETLDTNGVKKVVLLENDLPDNY